MKHGLVNLQNITGSDFAKAFNCQHDEIPKEVTLRLNSINTAYRKPDLKELEGYILYVLKLMNSSGILRSIEENYNAWEKGLKEHLTSLSAENISEQDLRPKYFRSSKFLRYKKDIIAIDNPDLEYELFTVARHFLFLKYLSGVDHIYEFGCGSCQNLLMLSRLFPSASLYGLDWSEASIKIAELLKKSTNKNIECIKFNMLDPKPDVVIRPNSAIITVHALEQLGSQYKKLLSFIMKAKPQVVLHYEPIVEFYDQDNLLDYLAYIYSRKRNYLTGFWPALSKLEKEGKVKIVTALRPFIGGVIHEASLIVWRPV